MQRPTPPLPQTGTGAGNMNGEIVLHEFQGGKGEIFQTLHDLEPKRRESVCQRSFRLVQRHTLAVAQNPFFILSQERLVAPRAQLVLAYRVLISILSLRKDQKALRTALVSFTDLALFQDQTITEEQGLRRLLSYVCAVQAGKNQGRQRELRHSLAILGHFPGSVARDKARLACHVHTFAQSAMRHAWLAPMDCPIAQ